MGILDQIKPQLDQIGKAGVNAIFPNDFEYYVVTLELTDSKGESIEHLTFPVTPSMISYDDNKITNIKKSFAGVTAIDTATFIPKTILISGTFGKKLRLLLGEPTGGNSTSNGLFSNISDGLVQIKNSVLNSRLKTGFGSTKILEAIHTKSSGLDQYDNSNRLYLYIPPLGHNFLVKSNNLKLTQDQSSSNMMWNYTLNMTAIARIEDLDPNNNQDSSLLNSTTIDVLQKTGNSLANSIKGSIF